MIPAVTGTLSPNTLRILYVGRLVEVKGVADLIDAVKLLDAKGLSTWTLRVVGDGPLADELRRRSSDETRIQLLGAIPHVDLAEVYRSADVLVLPSYREPWGLVVNEALGLGFASSYPTGWAAPSIWFPMKTAPHLLPATSMLWPAHCLIALNIVTRSRDGRTQTLLP